MTQQNQEAKQTDREPEEKLEIKALFQTKRIPANVLCGESTDGLKLQDHLHIKKEEEELWESLEEKQETDITAVTVKSEDEEEEAQCSLLHWRQSEENIKGEPATCSSAKLMKVEPNGDISEGPEAANTCTQQDTDGEETDCSDTEDSEDWREPLSQSEAQSEHMDMSCENFQTSENNTRGTSHNTHKPFGCDVCEKKLLGVISRLSHPLTQMAESMETRMASLEEVVVESRSSNCDCSDLKRQRQVHNSKIAGTMRLRHNSEGKDRRYDIIQGLGSCCSHAAAVMLKVELAVRMGLRDKTCTSTSCSWNNMSETEVEPAPLSKINFSRPKQNAESLTSVGPKRDVTVVNDQDLMELKATFPTAAVLTSLDGGGNSETDTASEAEDEMRSLL